MPFQPDTTPQTKRGFTPDKKSLEGFAGNVASSGVNAAGGIASSLINVLNPNMEKNTVANLGRLGLGTAQLLDPTQVLGTGQEETARNVGRFYKDRYGGFDKIGNTLYNDPVGAALDISSVIGGAGALARGAGAASKASGLSRAGRALTRASEFTDPIQLIGKGAGRVTKGLPLRAGTALENTGESYITRGLGQPKQLQKIEGVAGQKTGALISKYNAMDRTPEAFSQAIDVAGDKLDTLYSSANTNIPTREFLKNIDAKIAELEPQALLSDTAKSQLDSLVQRRAQLEQFLGGNNGIPLEFSPTIGRQMKANIYKDVRPSTFNPSYAGSGSQMAAKDAYKGLIGSIEKAVPGTKQLGREQAALIQLEELAKNSQARGSVRNPLSIPKVMSGGIGGAVAGIPGAVGAMALEAVGNSPQFTSLASKGMTGAGKTLQSIKVPSTFTKGFSPAYTAGKMARMGTDPSRQKDEKYQSVAQSNMPPQLQRGDQSKVSTYAPIVPQKPVAPQKIVTKEVKYTAPKATFSNKAAFGKTFRLKAQ